LVFKELQLFDEARKLEKVPAFISKLTDAFKGQLKNL
jgi:hypothetical protein